MDYHELLIQFGEQGLCIYKGKNAGTASWPTDIFLAGAFPSPLEDPYLAIRGCAFVPNAVFNHQALLPAVLHNLSQTLLPDI